MAEIKITGSNFEDEVLHAELPVLLDFWADWCGPCQMLGPVLSEIADENDGKLIVGKVNVDEQPELAASFQVASIPTLVVIKNGKAVNSAVGYRPKNDVLALLRA